MSLSHTFISPRDVAETYSNYDEPWRYVQQYQRAQELYTADPDREHTAIAREVDAPATRVQQWLAEGRTPHVVQGVSTARERGWVSVGAASETFAALNRLVAWICARGSVPDEFVPRFYLTNAESLPVLTNAFDDLNLSYRLLYDDTSTRTTEVRPTTAAAVLGRVIHVLGAPLADSASQLDTLPDYLNTVLPEFRHDFARVALLTRGIDRPNVDSACMAVRTHHSPEYLAALCRFLRDVTDAEVSQNSDEQIYVSDAAVQSIATGLPPRQGLLRALCPDEADLLVPAPELAAMYSEYANAWETVQQYRRYQSVRSHEEAGTNTFSHADIATILDAPKNRVVGWSRDHAPNAVNGIDAATEYGWCNVVQSDSLARTLVALVSWLYWNGRVDNTFVPVWNLRSERHLDIVSTLLNRLDVDYDSLREAAAGHPRAVRPATDAPLLGRVLTVAAGGELDDARTVADRVCSHFTERLQDLFLQTAVLLCRISTADPDTVAVTHPPYQTETSLYPLAAALETREYSHNYDASADPERVTLHRSSLDELFPASDIETFVNQYETAVIDA